MSEKLFVIYDERAKHDPEDACVFCCAETLKEARRDQRDWPNSVIIEYDVDKDGKTLINGRIVK